MPQLVKGGKHVFGWSRVGEGGRIAIPPEAMTEYGIAVGTRVICMPGSRRSKGFLAALPGLLYGTPFENVLDEFGEQGGTAPVKQQVTGKKGKTFVRTEVEQGGYVSVPEEALHNYGVTVGDLLLAVRGSYIAVSFIVQGPIIDEARRHPELEVF